MNATIISQYHISSNLLVCLSFFLSMYRKLSYGNVYRSCCYMDILISSLYPNIVANELYVWVSILTMRSSKIGSSPMLWTSVIVRRFAPQILMILKIQRWCVELLLLLLDGWLDITKRCCRWSCKVGHLTCHVHWSVQYEHLIHHIQMRYRRRRRTCNLMVISFPRKLSNHSFWSTMRIVMSVMLRAKIGR